MTDFINRYDAVMFDLDNTLIDNNGPIKYSIFNIYKKMNYPCTEENFLKWKEYDDNYWEQWELGKVILPPWVNSVEKRVEYLRAQRFVTFFNINYENALEISNEYLDGLDKNVIPINGAFEVVSTLHRNKEIMIATNGPQTCIEAKIKAVDLTDHIDWILASEICGFSKPMTGFFDYALQMLNTKDRKKILIVGDSLTTDILGGNQNEIDSCWFNPEHKNNNTNIHPTFEIDNLKVLIKKHN